ncbi:acyl-CoA synthetase [Lentibacillus saliphilus]|uniref:acyl-CoA synthetase n=1 Tax=Lentibacillus saliphilus TaxID=2737028 RepID=UPI001C30B02E|nr:long-chain fatty acid--CoA ligase [Lentibacillus saliphilus]
MKMDMNWFNSRIHLKPNETAVIDSCTQESWTYDQLYERANKLASYFTHIGVQKGDRVALLAPNHISYFDFTFAAMTIGAVFVPLNWRLTNTELNDIICDCNPKMIGVDSSLHQKLPQLDEEIVLLDIIDHTYIDTIKTYEQREAVLIQENDPFIIIYTGGTTGIPKGVVLSHRTILWNAINTIISWGLSDEDTTLTTLPMFHTGGLNVFSLPLILVGGKVVLTADFEAEKAVEDLIAFKCTTALFVPTMYHMIIQTDKFQEASFPDLKVLVSGGAPCPQKIYEAFAKKGIAFKEGYGLTEAGPNNFYIDPSDAMRKPGSVGKPMLFNEIKIITEDGHQSESNEVGELLIRGPHVFDYYWNQPDETAHTLIDSWVHTGDLARQDEEGYVYIVGRKKDMIITGGENVYPLEIEQWLEAHEAVDEAAVIAVQDEKWGEVVVACVALTVELSEAALKAYCAEKLARYKVPKRFYFFEALPKTHVGKINKAALKDGLQNSRLIT